jgi:hypothetical protein
MNSTWSKISCMHSCPRNSRKTPLAFLASKAHNIGVIAPTSIAWQPIINDLKFELFLRNNLIYFDLSGILQFINFQQLNSKNVLALTLRHNLNDQNKVMLVNNFIFY